MVVPYQTRPIFVWTKLQAQNSIASRKEKKTFWREVQKLFLVVHLSFSHVKQLFMKLFFEILETYAKLFLALTPVDYTSTHNVNPYTQVLIRDGISIQGWLVSPLHKTRPAALKQWSCPGFIEQDQNVKTWSLQITDRQMKNDCWRNFFSLQHCVWSHGLLLLVSVSAKSTSIYHWRR